MIEAENMVRYIIDSIIDDQEAYHLNSSVDEHGVLFLLSVDVEHVGRVIGKRGVNVNAIRSLLRALSMKHSAHYYLKIDIWEHPNE